MSQVQFNLLPDIKMTYVKAQRTKRLVVLVAFLVTGVTLAIFLVILVTVDGLQKKQLSNADKDIAKYTKQLENTKDLSQILTIQNQLKTLATLHQEKRAASRLFTYLPQVTPANVNIGKISIDFAANTMEIDGTTDSLASVNKFIDTLKFTKYKIDEQSSDSKPAFTSVVETSFALDAKGASYGISIQYDPILFSNKTKVALVVPQQTTTRSVLNDPSLLLFDGEVGEPKPGDSGGNPTPGGQ